MNAARTIARLGLQEAVRRRVFVIVAVLTVAYLILYGLGSWQAFESVDANGGGASLAGVEPDIVAGATLLGLNMFGTLFLGTILAVFLTLGAVRGDAERGLLQPLLVRPVPRRTLLLARFAASALVCGAYVIVVFAIDRLVRLPGAERVEHEVRDRERGHDHEHPAPHRLLESQPRDRARGAERVAARGGAAAAAGWAAGRGLRGVLAARGAHEASPPTASR